MRSQPSDGQRPGSPQTWLLARARLGPRLLVHAPPWVRDHFDHDWAPMQALARQVSSLPVGLCEQLLALDAGYVAIHAGDSHYAPGPAVVRQKRVVNVAYISVVDLAVENVRPLHVIGHLVDHHLGCGGKLDASWLSSGGGLTSALRSAGARIPQLYALGYAVDDIAALNLHDYFAQSLAHYCRDRRKLNIIDPQIHKWFHSTLWNESFWQRRKD